MKHTISILVENEFGALARISGLFSGRGYNIESLTVAPTLDETVSRMTVNAHGDDRVVEQIIKQLNKLVNVVKVKDVTSDAPIIRNLAMIKVNLNKRNKEKIKKLIRPYDARILLADDKCSVVQAVVDDQELDKITAALSPFGIMEYVCTGSVAMQPGKKVIKA